jgi:Ribosome biogenesis protein SLX9
MKRSSIRAKTLKAGSGVHLPPARREGAVINDGFIPSKQDKRLIKHSAFVNRIEKAHKKPLKRRRPSKKLVTTLQSLADALPDASAIVNEVGDTKIRHKSMKSRPGAMKRKEKLEKMEKERFMKNMAQLTVGSADAMGEEEQRAATASRWAALRSFISQTMEQKEEFRK